MTTHKRIHILIALFLLLLQSSGWCSLRERQKENLHPQINLTPAKDNRTHRVSPIWLTVNNWGFLGNFNPTSTSAYDDPEYPGTWAPQCEYPGGSGVQYLYSAALWIGALIINPDGTETPRVSVGNEGWLGGYEFQPGPDISDGIREQSTLEGKVNRLGDSVYNPLAVSEQDFQAVYTDTVTDENFVEPNEYDGPHVPLGLRVEQTSHAWSYSYAENFIIIDYEITNIADKYLKNLYVGLYVDADVGHMDNTLRKNDDICGFRKMALDTISNQYVEINTAWISDNNGRQDGVQTGNDFTAPHVTGTRVLRAPNPLLRTSFNWWISNNDVANDFGPSWQYWLENPNEGGEWTRQYGTPNSDQQKYFILSNREFDWNQYRANESGWIEDHPDTLWLTDESYELRNWQQPATDVADDLANGYDTRYLLSWGPLGIFDHVDPSGRRIYRLNPGESFSLTVAYIAGKNFHARNRPQPTPEDVDPTLFDFTNFQYNALWAQRVYDNEMHDTPIYDYGEDHRPGTGDTGEGDGVLDTGDGWYGEDVGLDGLYAEEEGDSVYYFGQYMGIYPGPDAGELDGIMQPGEDALLWSLQPIVADSGLIYAGPKFSRHGALRDWQIGQLGGNGFLDPGDGIPDFQGPPPPPSPNLEYELTESSVILRWDRASEFYVDPFSRIQDFEGYNIWVSNTILEEDFSLVAVHDKIDYAWYSPDGRIRTHPREEGYDSVLPDSIGTDWEYRPISLNNGLDAIVNPHGYCEPFTDANANQYYDDGEDWIDENGNGVYDRADDYTYYEYRFDQVHPNFPRYYSVTCFDFGDYQTGTEPLESSRSVNSLYLAPAGDPKKPVQAVPNPYCAWMDYTQAHEFKNSQTGLSWENQDDGTREFFPQYDRRIDFINLPQQAIIRIYTVSGDLVQVLPHNVAGDENLHWQSGYSESWDLNSRNFQQVMAGLYFFSVEDRTESGKGKTETGKFVIIR